MTNAGPATHAIYVSRTLYQRRLTETTAKPASARNLHKNPELLHQPSRAIARQLLIHPRIASFTQGFLI
jgi:hypothetical protein